MKSFSSEKTWNKSCKLSFSFKNCFSHLVTSMTTAVLGVFCLRRTSFSSSIVGILRVKIKPLDNFLIQKISANPGSHICIQIAIRRLLLSFGLIFKI